MHYDCVIVGAGISGLYSAYKLSKLGFKVAVYEACTKHGGRILTNYSVNNISINLGAGRFNIIEHDLLNSLIKDLEIDTMNFFYNDIKDKFVQDDCNTIQIGFEKITNLIKSENYDYSYLCNISFQDFMSKNFNNNLHKIISDMSGCDTILDKDLPTIEAIRILNQHPETNSSFNEWKEPILGFKEIIVRLLNKLLYLNVDFYYEHELIALNKVQNISELCFYNNGKIINTQCNFLVLAIPNESLKKIRTEYPKIKKISSCIKAVPLFKLVILFDMIWWDFLNNESIFFTTPFELCRKIYISPIKKEILIYNDGASATSCYLKIKQIGINQFVSEITTYIASTLKCNKFAIPKPKEYFYKYWHEGVSFWKVGASPKNMDSLTIVNEPQNKLFLSCDMFSEQSGWINSALDNVEKIIKMIECSNSSKQNSA